MEKCIICDNIPEDGKLICSHHDDSFRYQLLDRFRADCEFFLGNGKRRVEVLWANSVERHIRIMRELHNSFREDAKPQWMIVEQIDYYEKEMLKEETK